MNSGAVFLLPAPDAARSLLVVKKLARGTLSTDLAVCSTMRPASAGRRPSHLPLPPGVTIPARAFEVAASNKPGGGGLSLVVEAPANPFPEEPQWSRPTTRPRSSIASPRCSKRASRSRKSARSTASLAARLSGAGARAMMSLLGGCARPAKSAILRSPSKAWQLRLRPPKLRRPTLRPLASPSMPSAGSSGSFRSRSGISPSSRGQ